MFSFLEKNLFFFIFVFIFVFVIVGLVEILFNFFKFVCFIEGLWFYMVLEIVGR